MRILFKAVMVLSAILFSEKAFAQYDEDWAVVEYNVKVVSFEAGKSARADLYRNTINGRYHISIRSDASKPSTYEFKNQVYHSDHPSYQYMFYAPGGPWYFTPHASFRIPSEDGWAFVRLIRAFCDGRAKYFTLFKQEYGNQLAVYHFNGYYDTALYASDLPGYSYFFYESYDKWYFNLGE